MVTSADLPKGSKLVTHCLTSFDSSDPSGAKDKLGVNTYACLRWQYPGERAPLLDFIRTHEALNKVEMVVSNSHDIKGNLVSNTYDNKANPAPGRSLMFALAVVQAAQLNPSIRSVKVELDMFNFSFVEVSDFLSYASSVITELEITNLFPQKPVPKSAPAFVAALQALKEKPQFTSFKPLDKDKPLIIYHLDGNAVQLLSQCAMLSSQPPTQLKLHVKKVCQGGISALTRFLQESPVLQTLYLDLDGKIEKGKLANALHQVLTTKKLLCNPEHTTAVARYVLPTTTIFLEGSDGHQLVVSPDVLAQNCSYFNVLFSGHFSEIDYVVKLPDCDGVTLQALVVFLRYGMDRRLDIPEMPWCNEQKRFQAMACLAHLARYLIIPGLLSKVYQLVRNSLKRYPTLAFLALRTFRDFRSQSKSIPMIFEHLALKHIQFAEVHLLRSFRKDCAMVESIGGLFDAPEVAPPTLVGMTKKQVESKYSSLGLKGFLKRVEQHVEAGYLHAERDLITPLFQTGSITPELVERAYNDKRRLQKSNMPLEKAAWVPKQWQSLVNHHWPSPSLPLKFSWSDILACFVIFFWLLTIVSKVVSLCSGSSEHSQYCDTLNLICSKMGLSSIVAI